ncbi:MAG: hypothetical protein IAE90_11235 [Ignavibacteria bacterium]|nr:hypothetical protein [Ignavibacteria bacterium]
MKSKISKFIFPIVMALSLLTFSIIVGCDKEDITGPTKNCTDATYPLWCPDAKVCCPRGYAHYCDGNCHSGECPSGTVSMDDCSAE